MSQISKDTAYKMAVQLTAKKKETVDELQKEFKQFLLDSYNATIPKDIATAFKRHPEYFRTTSSVGLTAPYWRYHSIGITILANDRGNANLEDRAANEKATVLLNKWEKALDEYKQFLSEVEAALLTLKTPKRIVEQFPEAAPFLPTPPTHAIVVNLDKIRKAVR